MIRVLHVVHGLQRGGLENGVVNIVNGLPREEFVQGICCLEERGEMEGRLAQQTDIFEIHRGQHDLRAVMRLAKVFRKWKPDIIHCRNWNAWFDAVAAGMIGAPNARRIWSFHGFADGEDFPAHRRLASRALARYTHKMAAVCKDSAERYALRAGIEPGQFDVLYNGVNTSAFSIAEDKEVLRRELGIPQGAIAVVTVGSLTPVKQHEYLLEAVEAVLGNTKRNVLFIWLGDGPLFAGLSEMITSRGLSAHVLMKGNVDNVGDYLSAADIFVLPSKLEGMSNAILEAMAAGLPVVANSVGGNRELVSQGETGLLCEEGNSESMASSLVKLIENAEFRQDCAIRSRLRVTNMFSMEQMISQYSSYYKNSVYAAN